MAPTIDICSRGCGHLFSRVCHNSFTFSSVGIPAEGRRRNCVWHPLSHLVSIKAFLNIVRFPLLLYPCDPYMSVVEVSTQRSDFCLILLIEALPRLLWLSLLINHQLIESVSRSESFGYMVLVIRVLSFVQRHQYLVHRGNPSRFIPWWRHRAT